MDEFIFALILISGMTLIAVIILVIRDKIISKENQEKTLLNILIGIGLLSTTIWLTITTIKQGPQTLIDFLQFLSTR